MNALKSVARTQRVKIPESDGYRRSPHLEGLSVVTLNINYISS